jgi:outer membrane murein-binding lipoprotein Lpp
MMQKVKILIVAVITSLLISGCSSPVMEVKLGSCSDQQSAVVENHIGSQIDALADNNWQSAYSYAAASFQASVSLEQFKQVINRQYLYLIFNEGFTFGDCKNTAQGINQIVVVDFQGRKRTLSYDLTLIAERLGVVAATEISVADEVAT